eukprot:TRINITY_DN10275_c0_g1_i1.p1 TRINITY_DN10275_c0_g1~~TRINITY_DN10275_c0_g1_i1.p1  ORF type:complete len:350 (+),score=36.27 TRINITY_DN10275_c0_g1_i1:125-1174(+)
MLKNLLSRQCQILPHMIKLPLHRCLLTSVNRPFLRRNLFQPISVNVRQAHCEAKVAQPPLLSPAEAQTAAALFKRAPPGEPALLPIQELAVNANAQGNSVANESLSSIPLDRLFVPPGFEICELSKAKRLHGSNIIASPYAEYTRIETAEFVKSSRSTAECPTDDLPEFAVVGRSNVGKSSLINTLVRRKRLAMTSKTPGKTQLINHFLINESWYLVDLPGYGYAVAPANVRTEWNEFTKEYFLNRKNLVSVLLLIDASVPAKKIDIECATWLGQNQIPMTFVFTKCDKRKKKRHGVKPPEENVYDFQNLIREYFKETPPWIMTSSVTREGRHGLLLHISQLRNYWLKH